MNNTLYVGNLPYTYDEEKLTSLFSSYGKVTSSRIVRDRVSGKSKGFGFVEFESSEEANNAAQALNNIEVDGRNIKVNVAKPKEERGPRRSRNNFRRSGNFDRPRR
ncbi:MAG: RNA-binding protein [Spirochaetes bacterium]|nr:RNA-binding protein [Spirochaetota bacterium]